MMPVNEISSDDLSDINVLLCDIDDTITTDGCLTADTYNSLERLKNSGIVVIPVTGRCAGWCDHIARMWPIYGVVGENGAFYMKYNHNNKKMKVCCVYDEESIAKNNMNLKNIYEKVSKAVNGVKLASDQPYRLTDLAIDFAEDVPKIPTKDIRNIVKIAEDQGAKTSVSSIHINCWFGDYSKLSTSLKFLKNELSISDTQYKKQVAFIGDSPNDTTMFEYFSLSVGVANVMDFADIEFVKPKYITNDNSGKGFTEFSEIIIKNK